MVLTISLTAILKAILYMLSVGVGVLLIVVLVKIFSILKKVEKIVSDNSENINELLTVLPETVESINEGVQSVKQTVDSANDTIGFIGETLAPKAAGALSGAEGVIDIVKIVGEILKAAIRFFKK